MSDTTSSRVVLDYTNRDFDAIRAQLVGLARGILPDWETVGEADDYGTVLLELYAYIADVIHFYIDRTASEAFLATAVRLQSVLYIADMLGYQPIGQQAAATNVTFTMNPNAYVNGTSITIPGGSSVYTSNDAVGVTVNFETLQDVTLYVTDNTVTPATGVFTATVGVTEGTTVSIVNLGTSTGIPNMQFTLPDPGVIFGTVNIWTIEGERQIPWTWTDDLASAAPTQRAFTTYVNEVGNTVIVFGDNASGRIPPMSVQISTTYRFGVGSVANNVAAAHINTIAPLPDIDLFGISVAGNAAPTGGTDIESIDSMRFSIPRSGGRLRERAVSLDDFAALALQVPGVAKSIARGDIYSVIYVRIAPVGGVTTPDYMGRLTASVESYLADKTMIGTNVTVEPVVPPGSTADPLTAIWTNIFIRVNIHVLETFPRSPVRIAVDTAIRVVMSFDNVDFGTKVTLGSVYRAALAVPGVEWAEVIWLSTNNPGPSGANVEDTIDNNTGSPPRQIADIFPSVLTIPRIEGTSVTEVAETSPGVPSGSIPLPPGRTTPYSADELIHDGLWVKVIGGTGI
jgi:hypothetical protein